MAFFGIMLWINLRYYVEVVLMRLHFFHVISGTCSNVRGTKCQNIIYYAATILSGYMIDTPASACLIKTPAIDGWMWSWGGRY